MTTCRIDSVEGNVVRVKGLDAYDGSPVLDIKPHSWKTDGEVRGPDWIRELHREMAEKTR